MSQKNPIAAQVHAYAEHFVLHGSQSDAWRAAYPKSKAAPSSVWALACAFHKLEAVQVKVQVLQAISGQQLLDDYKVSSGDIQKTLMIVRDKGLKDKVDKEGNKIPVDLKAVVSACGELNKMNGHLAPSKTVHQGDPKNPIVTQEQPPMTEEEYIAARQKMLDEDDC